MLTDEFLAAAEAQCDRVRPRTHFDGCESAHAECCQKALIAEVRRLRAELADAEMAAGCLNMVRDALRAHGCRHGPDSHEATPPMMYPEWIGCVVRSAVEAAAIRAGEGGPS